MTKQRTYSLSQLSERWNLTKKTLRKYIADGRLSAKDTSPGMKRRTYRIDAAEAERFWESLTVQPNKKRRPTAKAEPVSTLSFSDYKK